LPAAVANARESLSLLHDHFSPLEREQNRTAAAASGSDASATGPLPREARLPPDAPVRATPSAAPATDAATWIAQLETALQAAAQAAGYLRARPEEGAARSEAFVRAMDFGFLYDRLRHLFYIGYNVSAGRIDEHHYDLLASE